MLFRQNFMVEMAVYVCMWGGGGGEVVGVAMQVF